MTKRAFPGLNEVAKIKTVKIKNEFKHHSKDGYVCIRCRTNNKKLPHGLYCKKNRRRY
jgi:hypothetical protein